jgi:hypothetical protein
MKLHSSCIATKMFWLYEWNRYADEFADYCSRNFNKFRPYATFGTDDFVLLSKDYVFRRVVKNENDSNYVHYPKHKSENEMFHAAYQSCIVLDPYACSSIHEDGHVIEHTIANTNCFTENMVENGDMCFLIIDPVSKSGDKYSALELSINHIYKIPCPREILVLNARSATSTPVKTTTPTKPVERAAKTIKIDWEKD